MDVDGLVLVRIRVRIKPRDQRVQLIEGGSTTVRDRDPPEAEPEGRERELIVARLLAQVDDVRHPAALELRVLVDEQLRPDEEPRRDAIDPPIESARTIVTHARAPTEDPPKTVEDRHRPSRPSVPPDRGNLPGRILRPLENVRDARILSAFPSTPHRDARTTTPHRNVVEAGTHRPLSRRPQMEPLAEQWPVIARLALAALLGAIIGLEREYRGYPAGVRTLALVCLGTAMFTEMSSTFTGDSGRVAAQIVTGIGFLGAGVIVREGLSVRGVTTAATIWTAASVGIAVAQQYGLVAAVTTLLVVALLEANPLTKHVAERGARMRAAREAAGQPSPSSMEA